MRLLSLLACCILLAACAGEDGSSGGSRNALAASACEAAAVERLEGKGYRLDAKALAGSMKDAGDGALLLKAPITVDPGLATETQQTMECTVRFTPGKPEPDVISFVFNW